MSDSQTELEIKIRTVLEGQGIKATDEQLRGLAQSTASTGQAAHNAAAATKHLGSEVKHLSHLGHEAEGVLMGLERGGLGGLAQAGTNAGRILKTLASGAMGAVLIPAALALTGVLVALKHKAEQTAKEIEKIFEGAKKAHEAYAAGVEANNARIEASEKKAKAAMEETTEAIKRRDDLVEESRKHADRLDPLRTDLRDQKLEQGEKNALAKTKDPLLQARIKADFKGRRERNTIADKLGGLANADSRAGIDINHNQEDISNAQQAIRNHEADVRAAKEEFDSALQKTKAFAKGKSTGGFDLELGRPTTVDDLSEAGVEARKQALIAKDNLEKVKGSAQRGIADSSKIIQAAQANIDAAKLTIEETGLRREFYKNALKQQSKEGDSAEKKNIETAIKAVEGSKAATPGSGGSISKDGQNIKVVGAATVKAAGEAADAMIQTLNAFSGFTNNVTLAAEKTQKKLKLTQQSSVGGGG